MSQRLKLTDSVVINADEFVGLKRLGNEVVKIYTTGTEFLDGAARNRFEITTGTGEAPALIKAIEKALTSSPSGRVITVPASSDYTITLFTFSSEI